MKRAGGRKIGCVPLLLTTGLLIVGITIVALTLDTEDKYTSLFFLCHALGVLFLIAAAVVAIISDGTARTRRRVVLSIGAILMTVYLLGNMAFWWALGWHYSLIRLKYNDDWIIGKHITQVEERYGRAEECSHRGYCYFLYEDNAAIMPSHEVVRYAMFTDENGVVTRVDDHYRPAG